MTELLSDRVTPCLETYRVGESVFIARGPLQGLAGPIAEIDVDEVVIDLREAAIGLFVRCPVSQLAST